VATIVVLVVGVVAIALVVFASEPKVDRMDKPRLLDGRSFDRGQWQAAGIAMLSVFGGLDGLIFTAIRYAPTSAGQAKPALPIGLITAFGVLAAIGFVIMFLVLLGVGPWRRRIVLRVRYQRFQSGWVGLLMSDPDAYAKEVPVGEQQRFLRVAQVRITNLSRTDPTSIEFQLGEYFPHRFREQMESLMKMWDIEVPHWADRTRTEPVNLGPQQSAEFDLFFLQLSAAHDPDRKYPLIVPEDWEDGVPLTIRDLISDRKVIARLKRIGGEELVRFEG
jgi:hypothetical protein